MRILAVLLVLLLFVFNTVSALRLNNPDFVDERYVEIGGPKNRPPKQSLRYPLPLLLRHCDSHYRFIFDITQNPEIFLKYELFNTESKAIIQASHNGETIMPVAKVQLVSFPFFTIQLMTSRPLQTPVTLYEFHCFAQTKWERTSSFLLVKMAKVNSQ